MGAFGVGTTPGKATTCNRGIGLKLATQPVAWRQGE
jgi:hypothetical protein